MENKNWPTTIEDAVKQTLAMLSAEDKKEIAKIPKGDSFMLHMSLGMQIRNRFGLHGQNQALLTACDCMSADDASEVILEAVLQALKPAKVSKKKKGN